jgi:hypothetical protein
LRSCLAHPRQGKFVLPGSASPAFISCLTLPFDYSIFKVQKSSYLFDKEEVTQWRFKRIKSDEAKQLMSIRQRTIEDWITKRILHPLKDVSVHPYWFGREEIESL